MEDQDRYYSSHSHERFPNWIISPNIRMSAKEQVEEILMNRLLIALEIIHKYKSK